MTYTYTELRQRLRDLRIENNEGQRQVASRARRTQSVISDLENGVVTSPRIGTLIWWAKAFGYRVKFVLEKIDDPR